VSSAAKKIYKKGYRPQDLVTKKEGEKEQVPASVAKAVKDRVEQEISKEATEQINQVLESGQSVETQLGLLAKLFGFTDTATFLKEAVVFYGTYNERITAEHQENVLLHWAMQELMRTLEPAARQRRVDAMVNEYLTKVTLTELSSGHTMPEDFIQKRLTLLKENLT
jgi:hypothetical protein